MSYFLVVYLAGHLTAFLGPMTHPDECEASLTGFHSVEDMPKEIHAFCDLRPVAPEIGEMENEQ